MSAEWLLATMLLGFVAYGLSIYYYTYAQRVIGAARTSAYYAIAPFIGVVLSMLILGERLFAKTRTFVWLAKSGG